MLIIARSSGRQNEKLVVRETVSIKNGDNGAHSRQEDTPSVALTNENGEPDGENATTPGSSLTSARSTKCSVKRVRLSDHWYGRFTEIVTHGRSRFPILSDT